MTRYATYFIKALKLIGHIAFWVWNAAALMLSIFLILPYLFLGVIAATVNGAMPVSFLVMLLVLLVGPVIAMTLAVIRRNHITLGLFFGVQFPLTALAVIRVFLMRELSFGAAFILALGFAGVLIYFWHLWTDTRPVSADSRPGNEPAISYMKTGGRILRDAVMLMTGVFCALMCLVYFLPVLGFTWQAVQELFSFRWANDPYFHPLGAVALIFFAASVGVILLFPPYMAVLYPAKWWQKNQVYMNALSRPAWGVLTALAIGGLIGLHALSGYQPSANYVKSLAAMTPDEQMRELEKPDAVGAKLLDAYLADYRYIYASDDMSVIPELYDNAFDRYESGNLEGLSKAANGLQNYLLSPFIYKGGKRDYIAAEKLYSRLLDEDIQRAHNQAVTKALKSTWNRSEAKAGLLDIGEKRVFLREQNINIEPRGDYAVVEIEEIYDNLTTQNEEIFYYFSLPEDAVITGLWIGQTDVRAEMDEFIVAPRGAARRVYERQVRRNVDPALLEQTGPRQYRLRVFPIPPAQRMFEFGRQPSVTENPMQMHLQYAVPRSNGNDPIQGAFALPQLLEHRNIFWTGKTRRTMNGEKAKNSADWIPPASPVGTPDLPLVNARSAQLLPTLKATALPTSADMPVRETPVRVNVIVDTSFSMKDNAGLIREQIERAMTSDAAEPALFYLDNDKRVKPLQIKNDIPFYGSTSHEQILTELTKQMPNPDTDMTILLTDQGRLGLPEDSNLASAILLDHPLFIVTPGSLPPAYDSNVLDALYQSGGGQSPSIADAVRTFINKEAGQAYGQTRTWRFEETEEASIDTGPLASLAARQYIMAAAFGETPDNDTLDRLHAVATTHGIITPYSSMIVLVNDRQREELKAESEKDDRFRTDEDSGSEAITKPFEPTVSAVPEPHEWILLTLGSLMLMWCWYNREKFDVPKVR